jgi:cytochrome c-type biogenesis protein CcmF
VEQIMAQLGHLALVIAFVLSSCALSADLVGKWCGSARLIRSGRDATILCFACLSFAVVALIVSSVGSDFESAYIAWRTSTASSSGHEGITPWPGTAGALFVWLWAQTGFVSIAFSKCREDDREFYASARVAANLVSVFFLLVLTFEVNPFALFEPHSPDGAAFDLRLRNPALLTGYASLVIPLAWSFAWLKWDAARGTAPLCARIRNLVLAAWLMLTFGVVLGAWLVCRQVGSEGRWLGEVTRNVPLMPWLPATALLCGSRVCKRDAAAAKWIVTLSLITFSSCILATFHGQPEMPAGARRLFIILLIHIWALAAILVWRRRSNRPDKTFEPRCDS